MAVGLGRLHLAPDVLWAMTPKEYAAAVSALNPRRGRAAPSRNALEALMAAFPDRTNED